MVYNLDGVADETFRFFAYLNGLTLLISIWCRFGQPTDVY